MNRFFISSRKQLFVILGAAIIAISGCGGESDASNDLAVETPTTEVAVKEAVATHTALSLNADALSMAAPLTAPSAATTTAPLKAGIISYWGETAAYYDQLPAGALALINPDNGIFVSAGQTTRLPNLTGFQTIVNKASGRGVDMLGYVPTGYFNHNCNQIGVCQTWARIDAQVKTYFTKFPTLKGIFFDEAAPSAWSCTAFPAEYKRLRTIVTKYKPGAKIVFNAGVPDNCVVAGVNAKEIVVLFESDLTSYQAQAQNISVSTQATLAKGAIPWHLVHSVKTVADMQMAASQAKAAGTSYFYTTDIGGNWQAGENTWGSLPIYWTEELRLFQ